MKLFCLKHKQEEDEEDVEEIHSISQNSGKSITSPSC